MESNKNHRQALLSVLSKASLSDIEKYWKVLSLDVNYHFLKEPEVGMTMVRAKAGGAGQAFNMGEVTVTRSVIQLDTQQMGFGYTLGRNIEKSTLIAVIDECFQIEQWQPLIKAKLLAPLQKILQKSDSEREEKVAGTKVNFFTMVRGE